MKLFLNFFIKSLLIGQPLYRFVINNLEPKEVKMRSLLITFISTLAGIIPISTTFAQIVIQHSGATDPVAQGFVLGFPGNAEIGPVFDDHGLDAWSINSRSGSEVGSYGYQLSPEEENAARSHGWILSTRIRFVTDSPGQWADLAFFTGSRSFRISFSVTEDQELVLTGGGMSPYTFEKDFTEYHEYMLTFDPLMETASLWVDGIEIIDGIPGLSSSAMAGIGFGTGQSITHTHWNEVSFSIIPEPATVVLLAGLAALLAAGFVRWQRRRRDSNQ